MITGKNAGVLKQLAAQHIDAKAKKLLEKHISPSIATWDSLNDNAVLKEHFRDVARGLKKP